MAVTAAVAATAFGVTIKAFSTIQAAIDHCFGSANAPHGSNASLNVPLYFPPGVYDISQPLQLPSVTGTRIFGAGRNSTTIRNTVEGPAFITNGFSFNRIEGLTIVGAGAYPTFDLNWDGTGDVSLQSNSFEDVLFRAEVDGIGIEIGRGDYMGSENLFKNCFWAGGLAGLKTTNFNALQQTVVGGNFADCGKGIWAWKGSVPIITGVGFQGSTTYDIVQEYSSGECMQVSGCRSESLNFYASYHELTNSILTGCLHSNASPGVFAQVNGPLIVDLCRSQSGVFTGNQNARLYKRGDRFPSGYLDEFEGVVVQDI